MYPVIVPVTVYKEMFSHLNSCSEMFQVKICHFWIQRNKILLNFFFVGNLFILLGD